MILITLKVVSPKPSPLGSAARHTFDEAGGTIGREADNSWVLPHLAGRHAELTCANGAFYIRNTSQVDAHLNSRLLVPGETRRLNAGDRLFIGPYEVDVSVVDATGLPPMAHDDAGRDLIEGAASRHDLPVSTPPSVDLPSAGLSTGSHSSRIVTDDDPFAAAPSHPPSQSASAPVEPTEAEPIEELDPLALLNLLGDRQAPRRPPPTPRDLDGGSPPGLHFRPPEITPDPHPTSTTSSVPQAIPPDYDPLAPDEPEPRPTVEFSAYCPFALPPSQWQSFVVYVHGPSARRQVQGDSEQFFVGEARPDISRARAQAQITEGAEIQVVPLLPDCEFNPPRASVLWMEDWHRVLFRVRAFRSRAPLRDGVVQFYVGPVLVGELPITTWVGDRPEHGAGPASWRAEAYRAVFVSYCHKDAMLVDQLQRAYSVLGIDYIRDIAALRSGEAWSEAILAKIPTADIFQLCWSHSAKTSRFVEQEWRAALKYERRNFIRPVFWETPMPAAPRELAHLHFAQLRWLQ